MQRMLISQGRSTVTTGLVAAGLLGSMSPAAAQTYQPFPSPPLVNGSGAPGSPGRDKPGQGTNGSDGRGGATQAYYLGQGVTGSGPGFIVSATSNGGAGGQGGAGKGEIIGADGGQGGRGGAGGAVAIRLDQGGGITSSSSSGALGIVADGGEGGAGGKTANRGEAGIPGDGGTGGIVTLGQLAGSLVASASAAAAAIFLQSDGGNGGVPPTSSQNIFNVTGRDGGRGGDGGIIQSDVALGLRGIVRSAGTGILAESTGGNGAAGGGASSGIAAATGGNGGNGGNGGAITLALMGATSQVEAIGAPGPGTGRVVRIDNTDVHLSVITAGMLGESLGGAGGAGGTAQAGFGTGTGGNGGAAGNGGNIVLRDIGGGIATSGYSAVGLLADSIGGSGGNGSNAGSVFSKTGGNGGPGGNGDSTIVAMSGGRIATAGDASSAAVAQSIGGGGGFGADVSLTSVFGAVVIGGEGASGGSGSSSSISNGAAAFEKAPALPGSVLSTLGADAPTIIAQSIGGGGGIGGDATAFVPGFFAVTVGGVGGSGGAGGSANSTNFGVAQTGGPHSSGIVVQSIGGGGGDGGFGSSLTVGAQFTAATAVGGDGGQGGVASTASALNMGQVTTAGANSYGLEAQSIGGGGGEGGDALSRVFQVYNDQRIPSILVNVAVGGIGGAGGTSAMATVTNGATGTVLTTGASSIGLLGQSIGGGGGDGGDASTLTQTFRSANVQSNVSVGGNGSAGGNAGGVNETNAGAILTLGEAAVGIVGQSVGGGGGEGAAATADTGNIVGQDNKLAVSVNLGIGGTGGAGGAGGDVQIDNAGSILTRGDKAAGVLAQSVGGGGGAGGFGKTLGSGGTISVNVGVGGNGGSGGNGGALALVNSGVILTDGGSAPALGAQSVGGGGGDGGDAASGGGTSPVLLGATFLARGFGIGLPVTDEGGGIFSLGKSGISALLSLKELRMVLLSYKMGNTGGATPPPAGTARTSITVRVGGGFAGNGGSAGYGGTITANNSGDLATDGPDSTGILAASIGGGGGEGGAANPASNLLISNPSAVDVVLGVGGSGGSSGNGGAVTVSNTGNIQTEGDLSFGIKAQSIGGGGGDGGATFAENGVLGKLTIGIGGSGGSNGNGGAVSVDLRQSAKDVPSAVLTSGRDATALIAQSIGGGGGLAYLMGTTPTGEGGSGRSGTGLSNGSIIPDTSLLSLVIDGAGGASGNGGTVNVNLDPTPAYHGGGFAVTSGTDAYGVLAQSIGGGGGLVIGSRNRPTTLAALFPASSTGNGGAVSVRMDNGFYIYTSGAGGVGVLAQSLGGSGGIFGGMDLIDVTQPMGATPTVQSGQGGNVAVTLDNGANIVTNGFRAHGVFAQSVGGGGGLLDQPDGSGFAFSGTKAYTGCSGGGCTGNVSVSLGRNTVVRALGAESYAIVVQSRGNGSNNTSVNLQGGYAESWGQSAGAIFVDGAGSNTIINDGVIDNGTLIGAVTPSGVAIAGNTAAFITNDGTINGSILLPQGVSSLTNLADGVLNTGSVITIGKGTLTNSGVLSPGGSGHLASTTIDGNLVETRSGTLLVDVLPYTRQADKLLVDGNAEIGGRVAVTLDRPSVLKPLTTRDDIVTASGAVMLESPFVASTPVLSYSLLQPDPKDLELDTTVDFLPEAAFRAAGLLTANRSEVGRTLDGIESEGNAAYTSIADAIALVPSTRGLATTYDRLSGESVVDAQQVSFDTIHALDAQLERQAGEFASSGDGAPLTARSPSWRAWMDGFGGTDLLSSGTNHASLNMQAAGGLLAIEDWFSSGTMAGVAIGGSSSNFSVSGQASDGRGSGYHLAAFGMRRTGTFYVSGILSYSHLMVSETRSDIAGLAGIRANARASFKHDTFGGRFEAGWQYRTHAGVLTPFAAVEGDGLWQNGFREGPAGSGYLPALALQYGSASQVSVPLTLGWRASADYTMLRDNVVSPVVQLAWVHEFQPNHSLIAAFSQAPDLPFKVEGIEAPQDAATIDVGVSLRTAHGFTFFGALTGQFASRETAYGGVGGLRVAW